MHLLSSTIWCKVSVHNNINSVSLSFYHQWPNGLHHISALCFMNFHTGACLPDKLDVFLWKMCIFPLPSSSWQLLPSFHQVTMISVFLGCHCKFAERKEFSVSGDYLCCVGCNHRVRKDCYRHHSKETWQQKSTSHPLTTAVNAIVKQFILNFKKVFKDRKL